MTAHAATRRTALAGAFLTAASRYWLSVFPRICREAHRWHRRAQEIPDPTLRRLALQAQHIKRGNIEGSAAFAVLAPAAHRAAVIRAQVAFQSIYDYVDTLSEQPNHNAITNGRLLHQALLVALDPHAPHPDYYACCERRADGGYLEDMVDSCRAALHVLPSQAAIAASAQRHTQRIVAYQSLNLSEPHGGHQQLKEWAEEHTPPHTHLRWWETAASAGSSLATFALIAAAAQSTLTPDDALAIEEAYWPWVGALHSLLDSLIDEAQDTAAGQRSLLDYYASPQETAARLQLLTTKAKRALQTLPHALQHTLILTAMASFYLTAPEASTPTAILAAQKIIETLGSLAKPAKFVFTIRRTATRIADGLLTRKQKR